MRRFAPTLVALVLVLGCSRGSEPVAPGAAAAAPAAASAPGAPAARSVRAPAFPAEPVLAADGRASIGSGPLLTDPETGEALPPELTAVLEAGPGGPAMAGVVDLLIEEPAHRGRIPILLSGTSVIDLEPMQGAAPDPLSRSGPLPQLPAEGLPPVPAAPAPDLD